MPHYNNLKNVLRVLPLLLLLIALNVQTVFAAGPVQWLQEQYRTNRTFPRVQKAYDLINQGRLQEAKPLLEKALSIDPENNKARLLLIRLCMLENDYTYALTLLEAIANPGYQELYNKALCRQHLRDFSGAEQALDQAYYAADKYKQKQQSTLQLFDLYLNNGSPKPAHAALIRFLDEFPEKQWDPKNLAASILIDIQRRDVKAAEDAFKEYRKRYGIQDDLLDSWINKAVAKELPELALTLTEAQTQNTTCAKLVRTSILLEKSGKYQQAAEVMTPCIEKEKKKSYFDRISTLYNLSGNAAQELDILRRAVHTYPKDKSFSKRLLDRLIGLNKNKEAIKIITTIYKDDPDAEKILLPRLLTLYEADGDFKSAIALLQDTIAEKNDIKTSDPLIQQLLAFIGYLPEEQRYPMYSRLLKQLPTLSYSVLNLVINELSRNDQGQQLATLLATYYPFATLSPIQQQELLLLASSTFYQQGDAEKGRHALAEINFSQVKDPEMMNRVCAFYASRECNDFLKAFQELPQLDPPAIQPLMYAGYCYLKENMPGLAVNTLERIQSMGSSLSPKEEESIFRNLAYSYAAMLDYEQAYSYFKKHYLLTQDQVSALQSAGMAFQLHKQKQAESWLSKTDVHKLPTPQLRSRFFSLKGQLLDAKKQYAEAEPFFLSAIKEEDNGDNWFNWAGNRRQVGDLDQAVEGMKKALSFAPDNAAWQTTLAYIYRQTGNDQQAASYFNLALKGKPDQLPLYEDLAYTEKRLHHNDRAIELFKTVIDNSRYVTSASKEDKKKHIIRIFAIRREVADIDKKFFATLGTSVNFLSEDPGQSTPASPISTPLSTGYGEFTAGWQPPTIGYNNGRTLQVFTRLLWGMPTGEIIPDSDTLQPTLGVRYKPFSDHNLVLSGERFFKAGSRSRDDWFLRLAASVDRGLDWHPVESNWSYSSIFAESGYYTNTATGLASGEARFGHSIKVDILPTPSVVVPYALAGMSWNNDNDQRDNFYRFDIGLGVQLWNWSNDSTYKAYETKTTLGLELRQSIGGNIDTGRIIMLRFNTGL